MDKNKKRNEMRGKIWKILYDNNIEMEYADELIDELCVLFNVSKCCSVCNNHHEGDNNWCSDCLNIMK